MKNFEYPNRQRMSQFVTTEMRMFNSVGGVRAVTWITIITLWLEILFAFFYFLSRGRSRDSLVHMSLLIAVFVLYLIATVVKNIYSRRNGEYYDVTMFYLSASFFISAFSSYLFLSTAWFWNFNGVIPGGSASVVKYVISHIFWLPGAALLFYAVMLLFEPKSSRVRFGGFYWINCLLPALPLAVTLIVSMIKFPRRQAEAAEVLAFLSITLLLYIAVRYAVKGFLYFLLNRTEPRNNEGTAIPDTKTVRHAYENETVESAALSEEIAKKAELIALRRNSKEDKLEVETEEKKEEPTKPKAEKSKPEKTDATNEDKAENEPTAEDKPKEVKKTKKDKAAEKKTKPAKDSEKPKENSPKSKDKAKPPIKDILLNAAKNVAPKKTEKKDDKEIKKSAKPPIKEIILNAAKNVTPKKTEKKDDKETEKPEQGKKVFRVKPLEEPREKKIYHRENKK